jgi:tRNA (cytidine/uridine-2'-O-)-methyltransferase
MFNLVLVRPEIPQNTGNIGRLCVNTGCRLHLVHPLAFSLEEKYRRRAGLDYWPHLDWCEHADTRHFLRASAPELRFFFSTRGTRTLWDCPFPPGAFLIFGNETSGLPPAWYRRFADRLYRIPMPGPHARSLNLANAAAVVVFEGLRQNRGTRLTSTAQE